MAKQYSVAVCIWLMCEVVQATVTAVAEYVCGQVHASSTVVAMRSRAQTRTSQNPKGNSRVFKCNVKSLVGPDDQHGPSEHGTGRVQP